MHVHLKCLFLPLISSDCPTTLQKGPYRGRPLRWRIQFYLFSQETAAMWLLLNQPDSIGGMWFYCAVNYTDSSACNRFSVQSQFDILDTCFKHILETQCGLHASFNSLMERQQLKTMKYSVSECVSGDKMIHNVAELSESFLIRCWKC